MNLLQMLDFAPKRLMETPPGLKKLKSKKRRKKHIAKIAPQEKIQELDLEPIKFKLIKEKNWTIDKADKVEKLYKTYLLLFALYPHEEHVPTQDIDDMWHSHILDTQKYMADCHDLFGFYLHHYPYLGMLGAEDVVKATAQFDATRNRFLEVSGLDLTHASDCGGGGCGGSSCGGSSCSSSSCSSASCSSHSCSGGGHDGGHGHDPGGGHHAPDIFPIIGSCTSPSSVPSTPLRDEWNKKKDKNKPPQKTPSNDQNKKKPSIWRRIIGLAGMGVPQPVSRWERSVDPSLMRKQGRPVRADLLRLTAKDRAPQDTRH